MGKFRRGTLDEAGYSHITIGIDRFIETGFGQISLAHSASDSKLYWAGLCRSILLH